MTAARSLGAIIRDRRMELGLTKSAAAKRAQLARGTWHEVEAGIRTNMFPETLHKIDQALDWPTGTIHKLSRPLDEYHGTVVYDAGTPTIIDKAPIEETTMTLHDISRMLSDIARRLARMLDQQ